MKLGSIRDLSGMTSVLKDPQSKGQDPVYWVFPDIGQDRWANMTVIAPGSYSGEFPKTFGHYHPNEAPDETYHLVEGEGVLLLQKKHLKDGTFDPAKVDAVYLIKAKPGDEIVINKEFGHSWSNVGFGPLVSFDDWRTGHTPSDYQPIESTHGMAYYLMSENEEIKAVPNPNYQDLPEAKWLTAAEFANLDVA